MNVVIYPRYSSYRQNETSIEAQLKECYDFCKRNGYTVVGEYIDRATSAKTDNRPEFQRMIADSSKGLFQAIIVYQLDRFARNRYDSATYKAKLKKNGVRVLSAKENISDDASGILIESVLEGMAEYYSVELGQKVNRNMRLNAERGLFNGGFAPLGYKVVDITIDTYKKKKLVIDPSTAPIVQEIFEMRANNTTILDIVDYLNKKGYKNSKGKAFEDHSLQTMLSNKRYIGTNTYGEEEFPNTIPAIISEDLFNRVQVVKDSYKHSPGKAKAKDEYLLTGKLFCGHCKSAMVGISGSSKGGNTYYYYTCNGAKKKICNRRNVPKHYIENIVIERCRELLTKQNIEIIANEVINVCKKESNESTLLRCLEKQLKETNSSIENLMKAFEKGENIDLINSRLNVKRNEVEELEKQIITEKMKFTNLSKKHIVYFLSKLKHGNTDTLTSRKTLINLFINKIYLYDDKVTIIFNIGSNPVNVDIALLDAISSNANKNELNLFSSKFSSPE